MKQYVFTKKIEDMSVEDVNQQQREIMEMELYPLVPLNFVGDSTEVNYEYGELEGICPMTGLPDNYELTIKYTPDSFVPELKSLKMYLTDFRNLPILHEHLVNKIYREFKEAIRPLTLVVSISVAIRGGIKTTLTKEM